MSNKLIRGNNIFAMKSDNTSITEMLTMLGVEPTAEMVAAAAGEFGTNGNEFTLTEMHKFLKDKGIMSSVDSNEKVASVVDVR